MASTHYGDQVFFGGISMVVTTLGDNHPQLGQRINYAGNEYVFVYNAGGQQISVGQGAVLSAISGFSVTVSSTVSKMAGFIGVCKHATLVTDTYGWLLTRGFSKIDTDSALAIGDGFCLGADGVFENASGLTGPILGKAMSACASGTATGPAYFG